MENEGFQEVEHTADWAIKVWAPDLEGLLRAAAEGMFRLLEVHPTSDQGTKEQFEVSADDAETLLVSWLEELLFLHEMHGQAISISNIKLIDALRLQANVQRLPATKPKKQIKAVTFHQLAIKEHDDRLQTEIVFDV